MSVRITALAEADLEQIGNFIAESSPLRAESFVAEIVERCLGLAVQPKRYPVLTVRQGREIRRCPFGSYLIFYAVLGSDVEIEHIVHSARDYMRILFPEA